MQPKPLSEEFLIARGACCGTGCQNCPYEPKHTTGSTKIRKKSSTASGIRTRDLRLEKAPS